MENSKFKNLTFYIKEISHALHKLVIREIYYYQIKPIEALFFLTYRCTSRCRICEMWKRKFPIENELGLDGWKKVVDMVHSFNINLIYLFGGDTLLRKDILLPLIKYIKSKDIYCNTTINGNLLDKDMASILVTSGIDCVWISLDGIGEVHDKIRGREGSFQRVKSGLENLIEARGNLKIPKIALNCTISSLNINGFEEVLPFAIDMGVDEVDFEYAGEIKPESAQKSQINGYIPNPYFINRGESILLNIEQSAFLKKKLKEIKEIARNNSLNISTRNIDCLSIENIVTGMPPRKKCYLSRYHVNIDPMGNVIPCLFFESYYLGNINEEELSKIWGNQKHRRFLQYVDAKKVDMCKYCVIGIQRNPTFFQSVSSLRRNLWDIVKANLFNK